ncbi:MAG: cytochrome c biogenesis protein CcdA [Planctomycetota bacterium]|nr:cytochrome c biogenesis protein CcdA [Planctomycetota bacterium]
MILKIALILTSLIASAAPSQGPGQKPGLPNFGIPVPQARQEAPRFFDSRDSVEVSATPSQREVVPGDDLVIAVIFDHDTGWHIHTNQPDVPPELGEAEDYVATELRVELDPDAGLIAHPPFIQWPEEHVVQVAFGASPVDYAVYEGRAVAYLPITVAADAEPGTTTVRLKPIFQVCDDTTCLAPSPRPGEAGWDDYGIPVELTIVALADKTTSPTPDASLFGGFDPGVFERIRSGEAPPDVVAFDTFGLNFDIDASGWGLLLLLLVAAFGGFLLNLTPCVLPVIPLKIMALSGSGAHRSRTLLLGIVMMAGIIFFWLVLGGLMAFVSGFTATNQLFQYPAFTITVGLIIGLMAIGMCGLFTIRLPGKLYMVNPKHDTVHGSFLFGIMTAVLSTPCTAPFMGAAAAWATTEPPGITMLVFAAIGLGMGAPYLILAAFPRLTDRMPKAGAASELIKQVMGLLMLAAAAYFVGVGLSGVLAVPPEPPGRNYLWVVAGILMVAGGWLAWRTFAISPSWKQRSIFGVIGALLIATGVLGGIELTDKGPIDWIYYTPERLEESLEDGDVVVLEFTAEWCLNCKALEQTVLASDAVTALFQDGEAVPMKIDLTGNNTVGNDLLAEVGGLRIPLLIVLAPDGREVFRGDFYTIEQVLEAVRLARGDG